MINVIGASPTPPSSIPNDPTNEVAPPIIAPKLGNTTSNKPPKKKKRKIPLKYIIGGILLILLLIGGGAGLYLMRVQQDLRQQASVGDLYPTSPPTGGCGPSSAARCQGRNPGFVCDASGGGVCEVLTNQSAERGTTMCECRRSGSDPAPTDPPNERLAPTDPPTPTDEPTLTPTDEATPIEPTPTDEPGDADDPEPTDEATPIDLGDEDDSGDLIADSGGDESYDYNDGQGGAQPELPEELPETGPEDWLNYLKIGLGSLGVGAILLLFL